LQIKRSDEINSTNLKRKHQKLIKSWSKLTSIYNFFDNNSFYGELFRTLNENELNEETQLKIEKFLKDQAKKSMDTDLEDKNNKFRFGEPGYIVSSKEDSSIMEIIIKSKKDFTKLVKNYKINNEDSALGNKLPKLINVINSIKISYMVSISIGRLLAALSNYQMINKNNKFVDVSEGLGKDLIKQFLFNTYNEKIAKNDLKLSYLE
jgi:hypothetical protein